MARSLTLVVLGAALLVACSADAGDQSQTAADATDAATTSIEPQPSTDDTEPPTTTDATMPPSTATSSTTAPSTSTTTTSTAVPDATGADVRDCVRVDDFDDLGGWVVVNDGVMGGRSIGQATVDESTLRFTGTIVTAGGGFTSIRRELSSGELAGSDRLRVRLRPDARIYGITLEDDQALNGRRIAHGADLLSTDDLDSDGYTTVELPFALLEPTVFGQLVLAEPFRPDASSEIGIIIADGVDGEFAVDVDWIEACG